MQTGEEHAQAETRAQQCSFQCFVMILNDLSKCVIVFLQKIIIF